MYQPATRPAFLKHVSELPGSSTVYVSPPGAKVVGVALEGPARFSSGVTSRGQLLCSHPGVAWMCATDEVHAS